MSNRGAILAHNGWRGRAYYLLFPLDWFGPDDNDARLSYQQLKVEELVPFHALAVPAMVFLAAGTPLPWFGFWVLLSGQAFLLAVLAYFHLRLALNQLFEVWLNTWFSATVLSLLVGLVAFCLGSFGSPEVPWD